MSYGDARNPSKHLVSIGFVILLHILIVWALISGLARKVVQVIRAPIETKIIEEVKPPPPPEKIELPPPPKFVPPPPAYIPPPEVQIQTPPPPQQTITVQPTPAPPPEPPPVAPRVEAPPAPPPPAPPPPAPAPAPAPPPPSLSVSCPNYKEILKGFAYPRDALKAGIEKGEVNVKVTIGTDGKVSNAEIASSTHRSFNRGAIEAASAITCEGRGQPYEVIVPLNYKLQ